MQNLQHSLDELLNGRLTITIQRNNLTVKSQSTEAPVHRTNDLPPPSTAVPANTEGSDLRTELEATDEVLSFLDPALLNQPSASSGASYEAAEVNTSNAMVAVPSASYQMSRTTSSIPDLWREWTQGLGKRPSVQQMETSYGVSWRRDPKEKMFFHRRKRIIDEIHRLYALRKGRTDINLVINELESMRLRMRKSLHTFSQWLAQQNANQRN